MQEWLQKRLSPARKKDTRWVELAKSLETMWAEYFDPAFQRLQNLRSIYTAHPDDLKLKIRELGDFFASDMPTEIDKPLAVAWRKAEILRKDQEYLFKSVFQRNFAGLTVEWVPLWAHNTKPYGTCFKTELDIKGWEKDFSYFLTSRGKLRADLGHIHKSGRTKEEFLALAEPLVRRFKPTEIVYDGAIFYLNINFEVPNFPVDPWFKSELYQFVDVNFSRSRLLDAFPADVEPALDEQNDYDISWNAIRYEDIPFLSEDRLLGLDNYVGGDGLPCDWLPLDLVRGDGFGVMPFLLCDTPYLQNISTTPVSAFVSTQLSTEKKEARLSVEFDAGFTSAEVGAASIPVSWGERAAKFDRYPKFDEVPCDFAPLDMVIGD